MFLLDLKAHDMASAQVSVLPPICTTCGSRMKTDGSTPHWDGGSAWSGFFCAKCKLISVVHIGVQDAN